MKGSRPFTNEEVTKILDAIDRDQRHSSRNKLLLALGIVTGFRISELLSLTVGDILTPAGVIRDSVTVRKKNMKGKKEGRTIPLNTTVIKPYLNQLLYEIRYYDPSTPLFASQMDTTKSLTRVMAWYIIKGAAESAGINDRIGTHSMRKYFAHEIHNITNDLLVTSKIMGHANVTTTMSYLHVNDEVVKSAVNRITLGG